MSPVPPARTPSFATIFIRLQAEESSGFIEAHCGVPSREKPYEIVIYLHVCVFDL